MSFLESWRPQPGNQTKALSLNVKELGCGGARFGGKTEIGKVWVSRIGLEEKYDGVARFARGLVLRKDHVELRAFISSMLNMFESNGVYFRGSPHNEFVFPNGYRIETGHMKDDAGVRRFLSNEYQRILIEQLESIPDEDLYIRLLGSNRSTVDGINARVMANFNPGGPGHGWIKKRFVDPAPYGEVFADKSSGLSRCFVQFLPERDNPIGCIKDPEYIRYLRGLPEKLRKAWLEGLWTVIEGQFFTEWDESIHVVDSFTVPKYWKRYSATDWGYRPDPWVNQWFAVDEYGHEVIYNEADDTENTPEEVARTLKEINGDDRIVGRVADPSMWAAKDSSTSTADKMCRAGWWITQADNDRANGAMRIREYLRVNPATGRPWLTVMRHCRKTIEAIPAMIHDEKDPMKYGDHDLDHWVDPIRYHLMERPTRAKLPEREPPEGSIELMDIRAGRAN